MRAGDKSYITFVWDKNLFQGIDIMKIKNLSFNIREDTCYLSPDGQFLVGDEVFDNTISINLA